MADPRFFSRAGPFALDVLAALSGARLQNPSDGSRIVGDVAPLETAGPGDLTFLDNRKYLDAFIACRAGAVFVDERFADRAPPGIALLLTREPYKAFARAAQAFYPEPAIEPRRAPTAIVDPAAFVPDDCDLAAYVVIERGARLRARCRIGAHTVIGANIELGADCRIGAHLTLSHRAIAARAPWHTGARTGQP